MSFFDCDPFSKSYYRNKCYEILEHKRKLMDEWEELYLKVRVCEYVMSPEQREKVETMLATHKEIIDVTR